MKNIVQLIDINDKSIEIPSGTVLAFNHYNEMLLGKLAITRIDGHLICESESEILDEIVGYIFYEDLKSLFVEELRRDWDNHLKNKKNG